MMKSALFTGCRGDKKKKVAFNKQEDENIHVFLLQAWLSNNIKSQEGLLLGTETLQALLYKIWLVLL